MQTHPRSGAPGLRRCLAAALLAALSLGTTAAAQTAPEAELSMPWFTLEERLAQYGAAARGRLRRHFDAASVAYPPGVVVLVGLKDERRLELYAGDSPDTLRHIRDFPVYGASGGAGPKLKSGDRQVPEGLYRIEGLNPNSRYHLSLRIGYPNAFDRSMAARDGRVSLGGDIYIHGGMDSVGCLAMGDRNSEDLFVLAADTGEANLRVVLSPLDFRTSQRAPAGDSAPRWTANLYRDIWQALDALPRPGRDRGEVPLRFFPEVSAAHALGFDTAPAAASRRDSDGQKKGRANGPSR